MRKTLLDFARYSRFWGALVVLIFMKLFTGVGTDTLYILGAVYIMALMIYEIFDRSQHHRKTGKLLSAVEGMAKVIYAWILKWERVQRGIWIRSKARFLT